tara:strand:+ start:443 stop:1072 length:630 start_codon:yes stop_codon:yes gene_type:complete
MAYFLGSDATVSLTTESVTYGVIVTETAGAYAVSGTAAAVTNGIVHMGVSNLASSAGLVDLTALDVGIGAMDEDITYMGARTPLKAEIHKTTTVSLTLKKKNDTFDVIYSGDLNSNIARWGVKNDGTLYNGLEEPGIDGYYSFGYRLAIYLQEYGSNPEVMTIKNAQMTGHSISLNADGTQEETLEFTSSVQPDISSSAVPTSSSAGAF